MSDEDEFKPGTVVCLKSGGPNMTVANIDKLNSGDLRCTWFRPSGRSDCRFSGPFSHTFGREQLELAK